MPKTLTISDEAYNIIKQSAEINGRSLIKELDVLLRQPVRQSRIDTVMPVAPMPKTKKSKKLTLDDLTEKDLATAKVTFEERPDFKEPEKWDSHAWPTV